MRPRNVIYLVVLVLVAGLGVFSFYGNVLGDNEDGSAPPTAGAAPAAATTDSSPAPAEQVLPVSLADLQLTASLEGEEAKVQTEQLHGKALGQGFDAAWIAQYGDQGEGTLWVSRSAAEAEAQTLMDRMTTLIEKGDTPFQNFREADVEGTSVVSLDGMGQKHYYFRIGRDLYWLAVIPGSGETALGELLTNARKVAAR